jgi:predicted protein tyrosine phosphatase
MHTIAFEGVEMSMTTPGSLNKRANGYPEFQHEQDILKSRPRLTVTVHAQADIEAGGIGADALVSIRGSERKEPPRIDANRFSQRILVQHFDDIPVAHFRDRHGADWVGPSPAQVEDALVFARDVAADGGSRLAVHCLKGKSRSAATALAIVADLLGPCAEAKAVAVLLADDPEKRRCFNPGIVRFADHLLGRDGRLESALAAACPRFVTLTAFWIRQGVWQAPWCRLSTETNGVDER